MWTLDESTPIPHWRPRDRVPGAVLLFSTRRGGVSRAPFESLNLGRSTEDDAAAVRENRERLLRLAALEPDRLATAGQVPAGACAGVRLLAAAPLVVLLPLCAFRLCVVVLFLPLVFFLFFCFSF